MPGPGTTDRRFWTRYLARRDARCPKCGYSLRGGVSPICPECAYVTSLTELRTHADPTEEQWHMSGAWALAAASIFALIPGVTLTVLGVIGLGGHKPGAFAGVGGAVTVTLFGIALTLVPVVLLWLWRRGVHRVHRLSDVLKWALVFLATCLALLCAVAALGTLALLGA